MKEGPHLVKAQNVQTVTKIERPRQAGSAQKRLVSCRDLATRPTQPDDVQRIVAHVAFTRAAGGHPFVLRPSFAFTLPHWTLWAAHFPFVSQTRSMTSIFSVSSFFRNYVQGDKRALLEVKTLAWFTLSPVCTACLVASSRTFLHRSRTTYCYMPFHPETTKRSLPSGNCYNAGTNMTS